MAGGDRAAAWQDHEPDTHYDSVHEAWTLIMGEEFHYGLFATPDTPLPEATQALTDAMCELAELAPGARVLDIGCGTGRQSCDLVERFGAEVLGITTSAEGVAAATALAARRGLAGARFEQRDGTANGLPDGTFDVAWSLESSHLMRDRDALLSECARVLAPGGRVVLCDIIRHREIPFREVRDRRDDFATLRKAFGDAHMEPLSRYATTLEGLGLEVVAQRDITAPTLPTFAAWTANTHAHHERLVGLLGEDGVDAFLRACEILSAFWEDGTLGYGILAAAKPA